MIADQQTELSTNAISQLVPGEGAISGAAALGRVLQAARADGIRAPFSDESIDFCESFSRLLFEDLRARDYPELGALAFSLRKSALRALSDSFPLKLNNSIRVPRGLVFHIPPRNVEVMSIYSWLFAFICGNANVIRVSPESGPLTRLLFDIFRRALQDAPQSIRASTVVLSYGHEEVITGAISSQADMRVIWGGNETIKAVRATDLSPHAHELTFFDRDSLCVVNTPIYVKLSEEDKDRLCERFYNDIYVFDQLACSSPRLIVWVSEADDECDSARADFSGRLGRVVKSKGYTLETAQALEKISFAFSAALDQSVTGRTVVGNELCLLKIDSLEKFAQQREQHCGFGLLFEYHARTLSEVSSAIRRSCQTMTHFGFTPSELEQLALLLLGRGVDRMVPIGQALQFNRFWDGHDLLSEFCKLVYVEG